LNDNTCVAKGLHCHFIPTDTNDLRLPRPILYYIMFLMY
jgi:hypothetical protein